MKNVFRRDKAYQAIEVLISGEPKVFTNMVFIESNRDFGVWEHKFLSNRNTVWFDDLMINTNEERSFTIEEVK